MTMSEDTGSKIFGVLFWIAVIGFGVWYYFGPSASPPPQPGELGANLFTDINSHYNAGRDFAGNDIVDKKSSKDYQTYLADLKGKKVALPLTIEHIEENAIFFNTYATRNAWTLAPNDVEFPVYLNAGSKVVCQPATSQPVYPKYNFIYEAIFGGPSEAEIQAYWGATWKSKPGLFILAKERDQAWLESLRPGQTLTVAGTIASVSDRQSERINPPPVFVATSKEYRYFHNIILTDVKIRHYTKVSDTK
jgi:hypothetical protein